MLLALLSFNPALAFAPSSTTWIGHEPARVLRTNRPAQARLHLQPDWVEFTAGDGFGWDARFDERTGTAHRAWGPGIPLGTLGSKKDVEGAIRNFLARNPDLVGVPASELTLDRADYVARTDTWYVHFDRTVPCPAGSAATQDGARVWRGGFMARIRSDKLVMFGVDTYPALTEVAAPTLAEEDAIAIAELDGPASLAPHTGESAELQLLPIDATHGVELRLVWEVRSRTVAPLGHWVSHVDAQTGELLNVYNEVRFLDGVMYGTHDTRTVDGDFTTSPLPLAYMYGDTSGTTVTADEAGAFTLDASETWTTGLRGSYLTVRNDAGAEGSLTFSDAAPTWTDAAATQAEIDTYKFVHDVREWSLDIAPEVDMATDALRANVNINEACNAYYDGTVNFYEAGRDSGYDCNNTGRIADVVYHEWGHGFHYYSSGAANVDGSVSEGAGDVTAMLQTLDPEIGPYFETNGNGIRELETNYVYPDDVIGEVHQDGLIFAGAVWDLFGELADTYGETRAVKGTAWRTTATLFADALKGGPDIEGSYDEFVVADDDDADLSNGTPHMCEIIDAFGPHGLGPSGGGESLVNIAHAALGNQPAGVAIPLDGEVLSSTIECAAFNLDQVYVEYSIDDGDHWDSVPLGVSGDLFDGELPALPDGTVVMYYLRAVSDEGDEVTLPSGGDIAPYTFYVGELEELYCEDFSRGDGDYTHELLDGNDQEGADDWIFGEPSGYADDATEAYSDDEVWGNDLGGGRYNGEYQPDIVNRLSSPAIDVAGQSRLVVQYRRWLNVEDGIYDVASVYVNDTAVWSNHASNASVGDEHTQDEEWMLHTLMVEPDGDTITLGWEIDSDQGLEFGGWNIDDVCVYGVAAESELLGVTDFVATDDHADDVGLSWTQPLDSRDTEAVVVRRDDRFPAGKDDGEVVFVGSDLTPGGLVEAVDESAGGYYAVYVGDGTSWTSGATEGANADRGSRVDGGFVFPDEDGGGLQLTGTCGCSTTDPTSAWAMGAAALALVAFRRGRRSPPPPGAGLGEGGCL